MLITIKHFIDAAHQLSDSKYLVSKACANLHGHTYAVTVEGSSIGEVLQGGMVVDFKGVKNIINELDHVFINDVFDKDLKWKYEQTTSENIAKYLHERISKSYPGYFSFINVSVCEGYKGEERANWTTYGGK